MSVDLSKRRMFGSSPTAHNKQHHSLPWLIEAIDKGCSQCGECSKACPEKIIVKGSGGFPTIDFTKGECTFCYQCAESCPESLFHLEEHPAWTNSVVVNGANCLAQNGVYCRTCSDSCDQRAISIKPLLAGKAEVNIDSVECNSCGACISVCPSNAIEIKEVG
ncbi:ferredoxin-type protein NapF [Agarivorans sp. TSD2052]|uniref:ferredoxin-type protein NapF n=1 Tax=Agarivorans sp. TSD2052 TaxID=2937286 RepID=UPI00201042AE|nr:ferredoxin-type protein NapF [Agarivorans sp. TSD2052]UPW20408.1 ferredoxin-type protein NapF [Agarivorans sp. TSD2052]